MPGHHPGMGGHSSSTNKGPAGGQSSGGNYNGDGNTNNQNNNNNDNTGDGGWENTQSHDDFNKTPVNTNYGNDNDKDNNVDPGFVKSLEEQKLQDYKDSLGAMDDALGVGKITNATYNAKTGLVDYDQTPGIITTEQYQTANLGAYLDSPDVSDKAKTKTLNQLQALSNSNLKGSKLSNIETDFVLDNLDLAFNNIKDQTKYSKYTSSIDETATTFADDFSKNPIGTAVKSGGVIGTMYKSITDNYKNNKALETLGYTGKTIKYNPDGSGDFKYDGNYLTGNVGEGERDAVNQLTPLAANVIGGTQQQASQAAQWYNSIGSNTQQFNFATAYANAKTKVSQQLNNKGPMAMLAVNDSPYYDWLKTKSLDKGIL